MRRRRQIVRHNRDRWLVSYADFITLLFAFFVVMYSAAEVDNRKVGLLAYSIQAAFQKLGVFPAPSALAPSAEQITTQENAVRPPSEDDLTALRQELQQTLSPQISRHEVSLQAVPDGLILSLKEAGFFDSGSAQIKPGAQEAFTQISNILARYNHRMRIEGHTDNVPIHNSQFASNWELSTARATEVVRLFVTKYRFDPKRLSAAGYAEYHPAAVNDSVEGRAQNRRVDIVVLGRFSGLGESPAAALGPDPMKVSP